MAEVRLRPTRSQFKLPASSVLYGRLQTEVAIRDERGKAVARQATANYAGRDRYVGLRNPRWLHRQGEDSNVDILVVDSRGEPVTGHRALVKIQWRETYAARVKSAGNAYITRFEQRWVDEASCDIESALVSTSCIAYQSHGVVISSPRLTTVEGRDVNCLIRQATSRDIPARHFDC